MSCTGLGSCLNQCECDCSDCSVCKLPSEECKCICHCDEEDNCVCFKFIYRELCTCGHRKHHGYHKPDNPCPYNCEPKLCPNDKNHNNMVFCTKGQLYPEWLFDCHGGNCLYCGQLYGHGFRHTNDIKECPVCYDDKLMTKLRCKHEICWDCWSQICHGGSDDPKLRTSCPLCRRKKW